MILLFFVSRYLRSYRRMQRGLREQMADAKRIGADRALTQHPIIDPLVCIGCGTCSAVCPEGGVLGVVAGKATLINGAKCVGHALCEENCPVGAITVGLGDISRREDIPVFSEATQESNVEGLYLAGEITGISLIKNAILHGTRAVDAISEKNREGERVLVIGSGPAGLTAVLRLKEKGLAYIWLDQEQAGGTIRHYPRQKLTLVQPVRLPLVGTLEKGEYYKEELMEIWGRAIEDHQLELQTEAKVRALERRGGEGFQTRTETGTYTSTSVILAIGRRGSPRKLGVEGERLSKVSYSLEDASQIRGKRCLVVGGGDSAVEAAMGLANQEGNEVTVSYRRERFFRIKARNERMMDRAIQSGKIIPIFSSELLRIEDDAVRMKTGDEEIRLENDLVYVFAGGEPPWQLMKDMGLQFGGNLKADGDAEAKQG